MYNLILKDLLLSKKVIPFAAIYVFLMIILFKENFGTNGAFASGIVAVAYMLANRSLAYDDINKSDIVLLSLPISRNKIVLAKYLSIFVYGLIGALAYLIGIIIVYLINLPVSSYAVTIEAVIGSIVALGILFSIIFPITFKYGYIKSKFLVMVIFLVVFFGTPYMLSLVNISSLDSVNTIRAYVSTLSDQVISILLLLITFLIVTVSYNFSVKIYKSREF